MQADLSSHAPCLGVVPCEAAPVPGLTARETVKSAMARNEEIADVIADVVLTCTSPACVAEVLAMIPQEWKEALQGFCHEGPPARQAEPRGIRVLRSATTLEFRQPQRKWSIVTETLSAQAANASGGAK